MTSQDVIREIQVNASEWLEMTQNPTEMLVGILAQKVVNLQSYIEYLEKRVNHVNSISIN